MNGRCASAWIRNNIPPFHTYPMRHRIFILFAALIATWGSMLHGQDSGPVNGTLSSPAILSPDSVMTVYGRKGTLTTVTLLTDKPVEGVMRGGTEINVVQEANVIHIQPLIPEGMSSVTFRVAGVTYVIRVRITTEDPSIPNPVFTFAKLGQFDDLDKVLTNAPVMRPSEIDLNGAVRVIQRASSDKQFRATLRNYAVLPVRKIYSWNHNEIHLLEAYQFADLDLIIFKVSWVNLQGEAYYLNEGQYHIFVGEREIPIQVRQQLAPRSIVFPGQQETVWLATQGYKLRLDNDWDLRLPPEASQLRAYVRETGGTQ